MTKEIKYDGYKNFQTNIIALWLKNDQKTYDNVLTMIEMANFSDDPPRSLANMLEEYTLSEVPSFSNLFFKDIFDGAMDAVDWDELAEGYDDKLGDGQ